MFIGLCFFLDCIIDIRNQIQYILQRAVFFF